MAACYLLLACLLVGLHAAASSENEKTACVVVSHSRSADCTSIQLTSVPRNLSTDILVLDASHNRIRELGANAFEPYASLRQLFLGHNLIAWVEDEAFAGLQQLRTVDLSHNALGGFPAGLLRLPALQRLSLGHNRLVALDLRGAPVSQSLNTLSLAGCHLRELPALDAFPGLQQLNVSSNELARIESRQLEPLCELYLLDIRDNPRLFRDADPCDCLELDAWVKSRNIYYSEVPLNCSLSEESTTQPTCVLKPSGSNSTLCKTVVVTQEKRNTWVHWLLPTIIVAAILFIVVMVAVTLLQSRRARIMKMEMRNRARVV